MAQQLIVSIKTSADGVTSETSTMQRATIRRREVLTEHIASVPNQTMQGLRPSQRTRQWQRSQEEASEIAILPPSLGARRTICKTWRKLLRTPVLLSRRATGSRILTRGVTSCAQQHGRGVKTLPTGRCCSTATAAGELQRQLEKANGDALEEHQATVSDRYRTEFVTELRSVKKQVEVLKQAHASDDALKALQDELLCEQQVRFLDNRRMEEMMTKVEGGAKTHEQHSHLLEQRLAHVTVMHNTTMSEVQAELEALEASTPKFKKIEHRSSDSSRTAESICTHGYRKVRFPNPRWIL
eukprot:570388-Amphidinium_carterae.1